MARLPQPVIQLNRLSHTYRKAYALRDVALDVPAGGMSALLGPDGVGKSTLLGLIAGARKLQSGTLQVLGGDMRSAQHRKAVGPRIAYMPQGLGKNLYQDLSVRENLDFFGKLFGQGRAERRARIERLTKATDLYSFLDRPAGKLSGGMKQKLGLCCALIHDPDLLLLDEPTTGVDPLSRRQFWQLIDAIRQERPGMSVLVATAYMDEAERFDWLIAMDAGRILATGTPAGLKEQTGTSNLDAAFVALLPEEKRHGSGPLDIPPLDIGGRAPAIVAQGLTRRFGTFTAVDQVSFEIKPGEIFGFLGSNGCGKTTTMKMLTGLLPASEGAAYLFGKRLDARDMDTRMRVGYMTQAFSLYGELTVIQNLQLHARLYHLSRQKSQTRIDELRVRFGLRAHLNAKASALPLGIRQRLSLAVAVIHEPEILILDEPTSGVDPVARDDFWTLLIELSRRDKVTVFISTHFMNEALRCDRISLMHAGKVLVYDAPDHLVTAKGADSLEDAFISYIEDAIDAPVDAEIGADTGPNTQAPARIVADTDHTGMTARWGFSPLRAFAYSYRETVEVMRDPIRLAFAFVGSMILLLVMAYGISQDVEDLTYAALDLDQTPHSRDYLRNFSGSRYFLEQPELRRRGELEEQLIANKITLAIEIPPGFGRDLKKGNVPEVSAWIDGANVSRAGTIEGYVSGAHAAFLANLARDAGQDPEAASPLSVEPRYLYNPSFESIYAMGPSLPSMLLMLFPAILMAVSVAREREIGTITNFYVTPTSRLEFLIGKQLPYIGIGMINFVLLSLMVVFVLQVPLKGSLPTLSLSALLYVMASTGYGLLISSMTKSQVAAVFAASILSVLPTLQFSGMLQPVSTLEGGARVIGTLWPSTYYMQASVGVFTKGLNFQDLTGTLLALSAFAPVFVLAAALFLRKQEV